MQYWAILTEALGNVGSFWALLAMGGLSTACTHWLNKILERTMNLKMYSKAFMALKSWSVIPHFSALSTYVFKTLVSLLFKYKKKNPKHIQVTFSQNFHFEGFKEKLFTHRVTKLIIQLKLIMFLFWLVAVTYSWAKREKSQTITLFNIHQISIRLIFFWIFRDAQI